MNSSLDLRIFSLDEAKYLSSITKIWYEWISTFVATPNESLKRTGAVCPCVPKSIKDNSMKVLIVDFLEVYDVPSIIKLVLECVTWFQNHLTQIELKQVDMQSLTLLFPAEYINKNDNLIAVHSILKPDLISLGIMLGEFLPNYKKPSVRNDKFYPLSSPIHALVIRKVSYHDSKFVIADTNLNNMQKELCLNHIKNKVIKSKK
jgi:hypothetical protein